MLGYEAILRVPLGKLSSASSQQKSNYGLKVCIVHKTYKATIIVKPKTVFVV